MNPSELAKHLKDRWPANPSISTNEIMEELRLQFPDAIDSTLAWRLSQLKKGNFIQQVGRGRYTFQFKPEYSPELSLKFRRTINRIKPYCKSIPTAWETSFLDILNPGVSAISWLFIEVERNELDEIFNNAQQFSKKIFANPDKETIARYLLPVEDAIVLLPQVSETPVINHNDYNTLSIEALLVNAYWHFEKYFKPLGYEIATIFDNALKEYNVNTSKLLRFAARRDKRGEIEQLLKTLQYEY